VEKVGNSLKEDLAKPGYKSKHESTKRSRWLDWPKVTGTHGGLHSGLRPRAPTNKIYKFTYPFVCPPVTLCVVTGPEPEPLLQFVPEISKRMLQQPVDCHNRRPLWCLFGHLLHFDPLLSFCICGGPGICAIYVFHRQAICVIYVFHRQY